MEFATPDSMFDVGSAQLDASIQAAADEGQGQKPPESTTPDAIPVTPAIGEPQKDPAQPASTTPPTEGVAAPTDPAASALPKGLEPYKDFLANKGLDQKAVDFLPKVVQMAQEAEGLIGRKANEMKMIETRSQDFERNLALNGIDALNSWRESNGLPKIQAETRSIGDQIKEQSEMIAHVNGALQGDADSLKWLNDTLMPKLDNLRLDERLEARTGKAGPAKAYQEFVSTSQNNLNKYIGENKDSIPHLDALLPLVEKGGLLHSHGIDRAHMASTPERLAAWSKVGEALHLSQPDPKNPGKTNLDSYVAAKVQESMNAQRLAANLGKPAGAGGARNTQGTQENSASPVKIGWSDFHG